MDSMVGWANNLIIKVVERLAEKKILRIFYEKRSKQRRITKLNFSSSEITSSDLIICDS